VATVLDSIIDGVREDLAMRMQDVSWSELQDRASATSPALAVYGTLRARDFSIISEVKRSSPSKGFLAEISDPAVLASAYEFGGAQIISVLTEGRRFGGSLADLDAVRAEVSIPVLRKDFMVDGYQVLEARAHGADVILLIVAALSDAQMSEMYTHAHELGMSVLVEVHDEPELTRALSLGAQFIGVNARNLKTLDVDLAVCANLIPMIPNDRIAVAESGISTIHDIVMLAEVGADAALIGEALVTGGAPGETVREWTLEGAKVRTTARDQRQAGHHKDGV